MKILIIKYNRNIIDVAKGLPVVAVCDPDLGGRLLAQHELPDVKCYVDTSLAIRESGCDTVLLTISDHAPQLALLALAYKKEVLMSDDVRMSNSKHYRLFRLADQTKVRVVWI
jgi:hypothetical protein